MKELRFPRCFCKYCEHFSNFDRREVYTCFSFLVIKLYFFRERDECFDHVRSIADLLKKLIVKVFSLTDIDDKDN